MQEETGNQTAKVIPFERDVMHYYSYSVVLQEVPDEISICFNIAGCPMGCADCSWKNSLLEPLTPKPLTEEVFIDILERNGSLASCVLFMGGEWRKEELLNLLKVSKTKGYKTCLYSGKKDLHMDIIEQLDYLKLGPYKKEKGGLDSKETNQRFFKLSSLNHVFVRDN